MYIRGFEGLNVGVGLPAEAVAGAADFDGGVSGEVGEGLFAEFDGEDDVVVFEGAVADAGVAFEEADEFAVSEGEGEDGFDLLAAEELEDGGGEFGEAFAGFGGDGDCGGVECFPGVGLVFAFVGVGFVEEEDFGFG